MKQLKTLLAVLAVATISVSALAAGTAANAQAPADLTKPAADASDAARATPPVRGAISKVNTTAKTIVVTDSANPTLTSTFTYNSATVFSWDATAVPVGSVAGVTAAAPAAAPTAANLKKGAKITVIYSTNATGAKLATSVVIIPATTATGLKATSK